MKKFKWIASIKNRIKTDANTSEETSPKKVTDEVLNRSVWTSLVSILLCMLCLVGLTWAWFTSTVESSNQIQAATLELDVKAKVGENEEISIVKGTDGYFVCELNEKSAVLTITGTGDAEKVFCQVLVYNNNSATCYYTENISPSFVGNESKAEYSFTIESGYDKVKIIPLWGETKTGTKIKTGSTISKPTVADTTPIQTDSNKPENAPAEPNQTPSQAPVDKKENNPKDKPEETSEPENTSEEAPKTETNNTEGEK